MKILHVIPSVSPVYGGPSQAIRSMSSALAKKGLQVDVATTTANGKTELDVPRSAPVTENGVRYFYFPRQFPKGWSFSWPFTQWLYENVGNYDLLHIHALFSYPTLPATSAARRARVPYTLRPLGTLDSLSLAEKRMRKIAYYHLFEKYNLRSAQAIQATSVFEARHLNRLGFGAITHTIPLGVDFVPSPSKPRGSHQSPKLLFLSRLHPKKGLPLLFKSLALLGKKGIRPTLIVAGEGDSAYHTQLREHVRALDLSAQIEFVGFVEGEKKTCLFANADIFILPSYHESFGIAVAEAMAAGLPVIVSDQVGISPEIQEYGAGTIVKCSADSLAEGLEELIHDASLCRKMGEQGQRLVRERFAWDKIAGQLIDLYERILGTRA